eukprot:Phypoly_transcript_00564.p1 GENE.Phypoly_transcript_00564~~Phypoly_transcript_00564.p1  ORF type:complete len:1454 (+),score=273.03 Phypoly_transcript_00564:76-4437(+)
MPGICGNSEWGPWGSGIFTLCFQDLILGGLQLLFIIAFGAQRLITIAPKPPLPDNVPWSTLRKVKTVLSFLMLSFQVMAVVLEFTTERGEWFAPTSDIYMVIAWSIFTYVLTQEMKRGLKHGWQLRAWLMLATVYWAFKMISLHEKIDGIQDASYVTWIPSCLLVYPLTILCVWFNTSDSAAYNKMVGEELKESKGEGDDEKKPELDDDIEKEDFSDEQNPEERANFFSRLTFWWVGNLVALGYTRPLKDEDIYKTSQSDRVEGNYGTLAEHWAEEKKRPRPYLARAVFKSFWPTLLLSGVCKLCADLLNLATPILLSHLIAFIQYSNEPLHMGILYAAGMFATQSLHVFFAAHHFFNCMRGGYRCRTAMVALVYEKSLHLSNSARQASTVGEIVNHQAIDAQRFQQVSPHVHLTWAAPMSIAISIYLLWQELGVAAMAGLSLMLLLIPLNTTLARKSAANQKILLKRRDNRMRLMNEVLSGVRLIKFFAWEGSFADKVRGVRNEELKSLIVAVYLKATTVVIWYVTPVLVAAASFTAYALMGKTLTAESAFASVAVFNILRQPLAQFPNVVSGFMEAQVSIARLEKFFASEELDPDAVSSDTLPENSDIAVRVTGGSFKWGSAESTTLKNINITVKKGELIAVVGSIGSGKSSFISSIIGEIPKIDGKVEVRGTIALVPQQPWIKHTSLKENILFYRKFDSARYYNTIDVCELERDVAVLPSGDLTEIGERGINLSGGQKARVSLARAVYQDADIYLLDSPLAAVDAHVGKSIFEHCIMGELRSKTRILVTHQLDLLSSADQILVIKDGNVVDHGDYNTLMNTSVEFARLIKTHVDVPEEAPQENGKKKKKEKGNGGASEVRGERKIMTKEHQEEGGVNRKIYSTYFKASGGVGMFVILLFCFAFDTTGRVLGDWWLSYWSDQGEAGEKRNTFYLSVYLSALSFSILFVMVKTVLVARGALKAAKTLHDVMLVHVLHAPMSFFDTTPLGRILNRFSKDQNAIDESLSQSMLTMLNQTFLAIGVFITIALVSPLFISLLLPIVYFFLFAQSYYLRTSRELQRLDSITKSPVFAQFSETLTGLSTIRSTKSGPRFIAENNQKIDANTRMMHNIQAVNRWLAIRMEMLCAVIVSLSSFFAVLERGQVDPGTAGLSIAYSLTLTQTLNQLVRQSTEVETQLVSVERVMEYSTLHQEGPYENDAEKPEPSWPSKGEIEISDLQLRYRPGLDLVLKNISCNIRAKEKIGICGRTGAGKSSFTLALFRMVEFAGGFIKIDGVDISKIGLFDLRSHLSIIPQDPTLFAGTIRSNLDPFEACEDKLLWDVLDQVYLKTFVQGLQNGLNTPVVEGGDNLSVGQRQLMCLGRALLRNSAVLVLDEATAAVDMETDKLIQKTIRERFRDRTVLTIAHRINTIIDCDRVMVLDHGKIVEFDTPQNLLSNPASAFTGLVGETRVLA